MANEAVKEQNMEFALQTAYDLFLKNGIENTTKEMVVRESRLSRSSIDRYFPSKMACVLSVAKWAGKNVRENSLPLQSILSDCSLSGADMLWKYVQSVSELLHRNPRLFVLGVECRTYVYRNASNSDETLKVLFQSLGSSDLVRSILKRGMSDGSVIASIDPTAEAFMIREVLLSFLAGIALSYDKETASNRAIEERFIHHLWMQYVT